jgi:CheY-like chemotaxis protein
MAVMTTRVLVVEDEAIAATAIRLMLESLDCRVIGVADSGVGAVDLASASRPDVVLMDIRLKGEMSGIDAAKTIRARLDIPVVFTTAYAAEEMRENCDGDDSFVVVTKPIQEDQLARAITRVCERD